jgi:lipopolysaccharide heptosyltransferase II
MKPQRILIINIFGIGDVLFTTPLISSLKNNIPGIFLGYLCNRRTAEIFESDSRIDKVFVYERDEFHAVSQKSKLAYWRKVRSLAQEIKKERFDLVIDLSMSSFMGFVCCWAGIKTRAGFDYKGRGFFLTRKTKLKGYEGKHVVEHYFELFRSMGLPVQERNLDIPIGMAEQQWAGDWFLRQQLSAQDMVIAVIPGGGASWGKAAAYKRWPAESYAKLADKMIEKFSAKIILMGDKSEEGLCRDVANRMQHKVLESCGQTTILRFAALLQKCRLAVVNDGGPLHVAVAAGTKTVSLFGPVDEIVYGPYPRDGHSVVSKTIACRPCYRKFRMTDCDHISCLRTLEVEEVLGAVENILKRNNNQGASSKE